MKKVLSVQDLSCLGKCSLTVAMPVISAMGCSCTVLPTAVLSTHTAFPNPHVQDLTGDIAPICQHWQTIGAEFDAISIGYLSDPRQAAALSALVDTFPATVILDPVLGDHGKLYSRITPEHIAAMQALCAKADYLLPNVTEAAALTGIPYRETTDTGYFRELLAGLIRLGVKNAVITGVSTDAATIGFVTDEGKCYQAPRLPASHHGTGDLFAAVFAGGIALGKAPYESAALAASFVERVIASTGAPTPFGVDFESQLPWLWQQL